MNYKFLRSLFPAYFLLLLLLREFINHSYYLWIIGLGIALGIFINIKYYQNLSPGERKQEGVIQHIPLVLVIAIVIYVLYYKH